MKLPFVENAFVPKNKITLYLLNLDSKNGKSKG
mgnify:CR=1 FL=1